MEAISPKHAEGVLNDFNSLVSERVLPIDTISKVLVLAQGALWKHHTIRDSTSPLPTSSSIAVESHIATHILGLHRVLLEIGLVQLAESPPQDAAENDLAQRITATFRRMLPALRIAGKWLQANFKYVLRGQQSTTKEDAVSNKKEKRKSGPGLAIAGAPLFWESYAQFINALYRLFPEGSLPALTSPLEEDVDMKGFLPLKNLMVGEERGDKENKGDRNKAAAQVHPNEEQLMRIADLLNDAKILIDLEVRLLYNCSVSSFSRFHFAELTSGVAQPSLWLYSWGISRSTGPRIVHWRRGTRRCYARGCSLGCKGWSIESIRYR
jgi:protein SMG7